MSNTNVQETTKVDIDSDEALIELIGEHRAAIEPKYRACRESLKLPNLGDLDRAKLIETSTLAWLAEEFTNTLFRAQRTQDKMSEHLKQKHGDDEFCRLGWCRDFYAEHADQLGILLAAGGKRLGVDVDPLVKFLGEHGVDFLPPGIVDDTIRQIIRVSKIDAAMGCIRIPPATPSNTKSSTYIQNYGVGTFTVGENNHAKVSLIPDKSPRRWATWLTKKIIAKIVSIGGGICLLLILYYFHRYGIDLTRH